MKEKENGKGYQLDGVEIAPGVVETIISLAVAEVPGVAGVGTAGAISAIAAAFNAGNAIPTGGIKIVITEEGTMAIELTIQAYYGHRLVEVAENVRAAVADALKGQIGVEVSSVDIFVDALAFEE